MSLSQVSGCLSCQLGISFEVLLPHLAAVIVEKAELAGNCVWLWARPRADNAACPRCGCSCGRVHSTYRRRLADAAIGGRRVRIRLGCAGSSAAIRTALRSPSPSRSTA